MPALPGSLALAVIADGSPIIASDHRNNYSAIQVDVNALIAFLALTAKGDLYAATGPGAVTNLPVGATGQVLTVDGTQPAGVKWATPASSGAPSVGNKIADLPAGVDGAQAKLRLMPATYNNGGAVVLPQATVTVGDTTEFPAAGTFTTPNGDITYTGKTQTTFTGCAGGSGALPAAAAVVLKVGAPTDNSYEIVALTYDATLGKWVSPVQTLSQVGTTAQTTASAVFAEMLASGQVGTVIPWRAYDAAGLKPQLRVRAEIQVTTGAGTAQISPSFDGLAIGAQGAAGPARNHLGGDDAAASPPIVFVAGNIAFTSTLWGNLPGGYTLYDHLAPGIRGKTSGGTLGLPAAANAGGYSWDLRWVG